MNQPNHYIRQLAIVASIGGLLFGYDTAVISGTVSSLEHYFITPLNMDVNTANAWLGFLVSSALIGCVIGGAFAGLLSAKIGRRMALIVASTLLFVSAIGSAWPEFLFAWPGSLGVDGMYLFIAYRILGGVGVGMASMLSPMYIAEIAPAEQRGRLVSWNQFAIILGMLLVYFVNWGIARGGDSTWLDTVGWRWMFASEVIPASLFLVLLLKVPESPRYLMISRRYQEAKMVLERVNPSHLVSKVYDEILESVSKPDRMPITAFGIKILIIGMLLSMFQQFVGINVVLYYAPEIFKNMGSSTDSALLQTILVGSVNLIFTVIAINTVDKWGRRPLQIIGALVMGFSMISLAILFQMNSLGPIALFAMLVYIAGFAMSWGPVTWVILSEMFPNSIRSKAMALAVATQWIANYLVSFTFPILDKNPFLVEIFQHGFAYWIYGLMSMLAAYFIWRWLPETKGTTLEAIEAIWKK
jgi:SP family xylose:H+ symportor-like MFS transporter